MSISQALNNAGSGLSITSQRARIASENIANASTPGYVRRSAVVGERVIGEKGAGAEFNGVERAVDRVLIGERREASGANARSEEIKATITSLNNALGEPDDNFGLFKGFNDFENALRELSTTPESVSLQTRTLRAAKSITQGLNELSELSERLRTEADSEIERLVSRVNTNLQAIKELNKDITTSRNTGAEVPALLDERQRLIDEVAEIIPVKEYNRGDGIIDIVTQQGVTLLAGNVDEIDFSSVGVTAAATTVGSGHLSRLTVGGIDVTPGGGLNSSVQSGRLSGLFATRDEIAPDFTEKLDAIAANLIERLSDDALDSTKTAGDPGLFTDAGGAIVPGATVGLALRISVNVAVDPDAGGEARRLRDGLGSATAGALGNSEILDNLLKSFTQKEPAPTGSGITGSFSATETVAGILSKIGEDRIHADAVHAAASSRNEILETAELNLSAVDTDKELQDMLLINQAYRANSRVISTLDEMLDAILVI